MSKKITKVFITGEMALSILRSTRKIIPVFEAGKINGDKVDDTLQEFLCQYQIFSHAIGQFKVDRKVLAEMLLHLEELLKEFCGDWNKTRPVVMESQSSSSSSMKSTMKSNLPTSSKAEKNVEDSHKQFQTTELGPNMTRSEEEPGSPPQRKKQKFIFKKMSPKSDLLPKIECHLCRRCYNSLKALKKHLKEAHKGAEVGEGIKEIQHKITCKICQKKLGRDLMNRHLKDVHSMNKPNTSSQLRGWFSMDDGDGNWKPLWLLPNELDPSEEIMVPLNADGTYSLYGFTFKGKERGEAARFTNVEYNSVDVMTELASKHSFNDDQIRADEKKNAKVGVEEGNSSKSVQYHFEGDVITAVRDTTEDNSKEDVTEKTEGGNTNNDINFIEIGETEESNANREEMITKNAVNLSRRNLNVAIFPHDKPGSSQVVLNENVSRCDLEENFEDGSFIFGDVSSKPSVVRNLFDVVNDEDGACGEFNTVLKKGGSNETKKGHKVGLVKVSVFDLEVRDGELWSDETDSDFEHTDSKEYTEKRLRMKFTRKEKRNFQEPLEKIADVKANRSVIQDFEYFMKQQKMDNTSTPSKSSTIVKAIGHLFEYHDSLLKFETDKDASFNLQRLLNPLNDDFLEIADPTAIDGWIQRGTGPNGERLPGRCREKLKGHARFRDFLKAKLMKAEFGMSAEAYFKRDMIIKNIEQITQTIKSKKVFQQLQKMEDSEKLEREQAREVLFPKNVFNEMKAVSRWYKSEEAKEEEGACLNIYKKATTGGKLTSKEFGRFGQWAQFSTCLEDKNRRGAYSFTNLEFKKRKPMWFPEDFEEEETEDMNELFKKLPENWDWNVPPKPDAQPSCWVIEVSGEGLKGGNAAQLILTRRSSEICNKFRDLKFEVFGDDEDELSPFFVNMKKKPLTDLQRTKGSLLERLGKVCGVSNATVNTFRCVILIMFNFINIHSLGVQLKFMCRAPP